MLFQPKRGRFLLTGMQTAAGYIVKKKSGDTRWMQLLDKVLFQTGLLFSDPFEIGLEITDLEWSQPEQLEHCMAVGQIKRRQR